MLFQIDHGMRNSFQIIGCAFLLSVSRPVAALSLTQIHIITEQSGEVRRSIFLFCFHFRKGFFGGFQNICNPVPQIFDSAADGVHHAIGGFNVPVQISDIGFDALALQRTDSGSHVNSRDNNQSCA